MKRLLLWSILLLLCGCTDHNDNWKEYDKNTSVPKGDPPFPVLSNSWIIDKTKSLDASTIGKCDSACEKLKQDGIAEMVVLVQLGVKHPEDYATHYGRWLKLGKASAAAKGGQNGLVWLIRPDASDKITVSVGRGLTQFTSSDYGQVMNAVKDYLNFNNIDKAVETIVDMTDKKLREIYRK